MSKPKLKRKLTLKQKIPLSFVAKKPEPGSVELIPRPKEDPRFRFYTDTGISGIVKAHSHDEARIVMERISFDPVIKKKAFAWDEADVIYPQITVNAKPV